MGYPNQRVSMTDVHGEPQQGGYLPAEIWHAYMAAVTEGKPCVPFPQPKEQISYQPFYGKFATHRDALNRARAAKHSNPAKAPRSKRRQRHGQSGAGNDETLARHGGSGSAPQHHGAACPAGSGRRRARRTPSGGARTAVEQNAAAAGPG